MIKYEHAADIHQQMLDIVKKLPFDHVQLDSVVCIRSFGSSARRTIARCHALNKVMQKALGRRGFYVLEFISEQYDRLSKEEKVKTILHELMHIPKSFGGGFKHHDYVCENNINKLYKQLQEGEKRLLFREDSPHLKNSAPSAPFWFSLL